jgi:hypothetical protein
MADADKKASEVLSAKRIRSPKSRQGRTSGTSSEAGEGNVVPGKAVAPPAQLHLSRVTWERDRIIHRIHHEQYAGDAFNPGTSGNARFSPIKDCKGDSIPTLYGGDSFECVAMETVFHDVPYVPGMKMYDKAKLAGQMHTCLKAADDLTLADLRSKALRKLGVQRNQLIDTEKDQYPTTRQWAEAIHAQHQDIQGMCWTSRQDDDAAALLLFGDRIKRGTLRRLSTSSSLTGDASCYAKLLSLAEVIGVNIVPGKG